MGVEREMTGRERPPPAEWERQELIGRRSRIGLHSAERVDSGGASPMPSYGSGPALKGTYVVEQVPPPIPQRPPINRVASITQVETPQTVSRRISGLHNMGESGYMIPNHPVRGMVYGHDGRVLSRYNSEGDNTMRREMAEAMAMDAPPPANDEYHYAFNAAEEEKTDPVAIVYNPLSPTTAQSMHARRLTHEAQQQQRADSGGRGGEGGRGGAGGESTGPRRPGRGGGHSLSDESRQQRLTGQSSQRIQRSEVRERTEDSRGGAHGMDREAVGWGGWCQGSGLSGVVQCPCRCSCIVGSGGNKADAERWRSPHLRLISSRAAGPHEKRRRWRWRLVAARCWSSPRETWTAASPGCCCWSMGRMWRPVRR